MRTVKVNLKGRPYAIVIGSNIMGRLGARLKNLGIGSDAYIITNPFLKVKYGNTLKMALTASGFTVRFKTIPDTEKSKSMEVSAGILRDLVGYDKKKRVFIVAFGGGVVGDVSGFVASIYKRGIPYVQIPTTLLAQVDSAIGGKTAVDLAQGKNLVGAFYQPRMVFSDVSFLKSLAPRQIRSGLAEVIKYGIIKDARLFDYIEKNREKILSLDPAALERIIASCSGIKAGIVSRDEKEEKGLRTILNFGHTAGHAIEAASGYNKYNHGEAIAVGMIIASRISMRRKLISPETFRRIEGLITAVGLPVKIKGITLSGAMNALARDKKFTGAKNKLVLTKGLGRTLVKENIPLKEITEAVKERMQEGSL